MFINYIQNNNNMTFIIENLCRAPHGQTISYEYTYCPFKYKYQSIPPPFLLQFFSKPRYMPLHCRELLVIFLAVLLRKNVNTGFPGWGSFEMASLGMGIGFAFAMLAAAQVVGRKQNWTGAWLFLSIATLCLLTLHLHILLYYPQKCFDHIC